MNDLYFNNVEDARKVLMAIQDMLLKFRSVSVADVYDLCGLPSTHEDAKVGWKSFDEMSIVDINDKHFIRFPATIDIRTSTERR